VQLTLRQLLHHRWGFVEEAAEYDMLNYVNKRQLCVQLTLRQLLHHRWGFVEEAAVYYI
jgi:TRAP-type C4-dicarboxylate transport system permease small subunit